ncbi:circadian locomoter output cycles protein kaput-like [Halichondria panicea]|uniref:circadian locomoter output cycles protein kaput-like n=1 Tax=Halichondria panicea TaxID=6063 RepID=UPI00312B34B3
MPVSYIPSAEKAGPKQKQTAKKRRRNQNTEIEELSALLPIKQQATIANGILARGRTQAIDKISVLRLTSAYLKFQKFLEKDNENGGTHTDAGRSTEATNLLSEALDGFLIVLDSDGFILYVSDSITNVVGLTQHDVIGQNFVEIVEDDDASTITDNLQSKTTPPSTHLDGRTEFQHRQFYVRIKSAVTPGRMQLSRFTSHVMIQVSGNLKVHIPFQHLMEPKKNGTELQPQVLGFVGECQPIESTSSILEVSVPQSHFTSTMNLDMEIISVEASVKEVVGYDPADFVGTTMSDYFHPGDCKKMINCEKALLRLGHAVSPVFRFASSNGEWVWMQLEGLLRYKQGGVEPQFWEVKAKLLSQEDGKMKYVEYREMYAKNCDPNQDLMCPHKDPVVTNCLMDTENSCRKDKGAQPIIDSLKEAQVSSALIDPILHCRELGLKSLPELMKRVLTENEADDFVIQRNKKLGWPVPDNLQERSKFLEKIIQSLSANGADTQSLQPELKLVENQPSIDQSLVVQPLLQEQTPIEPTFFQQNGYQTQGITNIHSPSNSVNSLLSPVGSRLDEFAHSLTTLPPPHTLTSSHSFVSSPDSVLSLDPYSYQSSLTTSVVSPPSVSSNASSTTPNTPNPSFNNGLMDPSLFDTNGINFAHTQTALNPVNFDPSVQNALSFVSQNFAQVSNTSTFPLNGSSMASNGTTQNTGQNVHSNPLQEFSVQNSVHPLNKTTSSSSLASSVPSPQYPSIAPSPVSNPISPEQAFSSPETDCLGHILSDYNGMGMPISPDQFFQSTENDSLEQILSDMISLNQEGGQLSVECKVYGNGDIRGYGDSGISEGNPEAEDVIQQFLS